MPLTQVTHYLNEHLNIVNPNASLRHHAAIHWENGRIWARLSNLSLYPSQRPIFSLERIDVAAWEADIAIYDQRGRPHPADWLYFLSWDQEDVVFLDRFLRVVHALHHLSLHGAASKPLIVDVHWHHIQAVEASHGAVFENLLTQLGLQPSQVVLRLDSRIVLEEAHAHAAAQSFQRRGYPLLAQGVSLGTESHQWEHLKHSGVYWVTPTEDTLSLIRKSREYFPQLAQWSRGAQQVGLGGWWPGIDQPGDLGIMTQLEPTWVSGQRLMSFELPEVSRLG